MHLPRENYNQSSDEAKFAIRIRHAVREGRINRDQLQSLEASQDITQDVRKFVGEHGHLPREHLRHSSEEVIYAYRIRNAVRDGRIDRDELQSLEASLDIMQDVRKFVAEHGHLPREHLKILSKG